MMMSRGRYFYREVLPYIAMVASECIAVGENTLYKAAVTKGLSYHVFMVYSFGISALTLLPLALFFHRKTPLPPLNAVLLGKFFILGFLGFIAQLFGYLGVAYSSPTMVSAMSNLTPATTFFLAVVLRMEKLKLRSFSSQAKIIGAAVSISGALVVVLYSGPMLIKGNHEDLSITSIILRTVSDARSNWILGGVLCASLYMVASVWCVCQGIVVKEYPAELVIVFFYCFSAFLYSVPVCIASVPDFSLWLLPADIRLGSVLYAGISVGTITMISTWGLNVKGPVFVTMFKPLSIAIASIAGVLFLGDDFYLGSLIGSIIITMGFYTTMWGKAKDDTIEELNDNDVESSTVDVIAPLLKK